MKLKRNGFNKWKVPVHIVFNFCFAVFVHGAWGVGSSSNVDSSSEILAPITFKDADSTLSFFSSCRIWTSMIDGEHEGSLANKVCSSRVIIWLLSSWMYWVCFSCLESSRTFKEEAVRNDEGDSFGFCGFSGRSEKSTKFRTTSMISAYSEVCCWFAIQSIVVVDAWFSRWEELDNAM